MKLLPVLLLSVPLYSQSLRLTGGSVRRGESINLSLILESPPGKAPLALQWELAYPSPQIGAEEKDLVRGDAAGAAGKSLTCRGQAEDAGTYFYRCILAGGQNPIPNGPVAVVKCQARSRARTGVAAIRIRNAQAVSSDLKKVEIAPIRAD